MKLSHTKNSMYKECPAKYDFHYNKKIKSKWLNCPLFFGNAIDIALNTLLLTKKVNLTEDDKKDLLKTPEDIFNESMRSIFHNTEMVYIPTYMYAKYSKSDYDSSIFTEGDLQLIEEELDWSLDDDFKAAITELDAFIDYYNQSSKITHSDVNKHRFLNWISMRRKGFLIIETYRNEIMPQIDEVIEVQQKIDIPNDDGDSITGIIDFIAKFKDDPNIYICDNKTSSKAYKEGDLVESEQLNLYAYIKEINHVAYVVAEKNIRKREPKVRINILKGKANHPFADKVLDSFEDTLLNIRRGEFAPNFKSGCFSFGQKCIYYDICHNEKMSEDLIKVSKNE